MKTARVALFAGLALVLVFGMMMGGCGKKSSDDIVLSTIAITPASPTVSAVQTVKTVQLTATGTYSDGTTADLTATATWASATATVATVSAAGLATGVAAGTSVITATVGGIVGTTTMTVNNVYSVTLYMASEGGGHMGVFPATIDPSNTTSPITVATGSVTKIQLQGSPTSAKKIVSHDVRYDAKANRIYYAQFLATDFTDTGMGHIGYVDLSQPNNATTNNSIDARIDIDVTAAATIAYALDNIGIVDAGTSKPSTPNTFKLMYCASGQDDTYFFPMSMSFPAYVDAVPKAKITAGAHITLADIKRTYIGSIDDSMNFTALASNSTAVTTTITTGQGDKFNLSQLGLPPLAFIHGATSADGKKMYISTNVMSGLTLTVNTAGEFRTYLLDTADVISGTVTTTKVKAKGDITGLTPIAATGGSVAYRASFDPNGAYIVQSGADRMLMLDATSATLKVLVDTKAGPNADTNFGGGKASPENHDVTTTPDGKYAILAIRYVDSAGTAKTSGLQLYDVANKKFIGGMTNTCGLSACHAPDTTARPTCGVVGKFN